jgi:hypothetical protein
MKSNGVHERVNFVLKTIKGHLHCGATVWNNVLIKGNIGLLKLTVT